MASSVPSTNCADPRLGALRDLFSLEIKDRRSQRGSGCDSDEEMNFSSLQTLSDDFSLEEFCDAAGSPIFQAQMEHLVDAAVAHRQGVKEIIDMCESYFAAGRAFLQAGERFTKKLNNIPSIVVPENIGRAGLLGLRSKSVEATRDGMRIVRKRSVGAATKPIVRKSNDIAVEDPNREEIATAVKAVASTVGDVHTHLDVMLSQQAQLLKPLVDMCGKQTQEIKESKDAFAKASEKYRKSRRKFQRTRGGDNAESVLAAKELTLQRFALALKVGTFAKTKHISYLEFLSSLSHVYDAFFTEGGAMMRRRKKSHLDDMYISLADAHESVAKSIKKAKYSYAERQQQQNINASPGGEMVLEGETTFRKTPNGFAGYLNKRSKTWKQKWMRRWFHIDGKSFYYTKGENEEDRLQEFDLTLASVRSARKVVRDFCFEVVSSAPNGGMRKMILQASSQTDMALWMKGITDAIAGALDHVEATSRSDGGVEHHRRSNVIAREHQIKILSAAPGNKYCSECGSTKDVEWISLNLCVVFCLDCAGIHRSLGVHISQCRSFKLDVLDHSILQCFGSLGNEKSNSVWEANPTAVQGLRKPTPGTPRATREAWIRAKYETRMFLGKDMLRERGFHQDIVTAAAENDMASLLRCIAWEEDLNRINEHGATALGAAAHLGFMNPITLLLLNGASCNACSPVQMWTPLHAAAYGGNKDAVRILVAKGADVDAVEANGATPIDIAKKFENDECLEIMGEETPGLDDQGTTGSKSPSPLQRSGGDGDAEQNAVHFSMAPPQDDELDSPPFARQEDRARRASRSSFGKSSGRRPSWKVAAKNSARRRAESMSSNDLQDVLL
jgi:hypothetical protein